MNRIKITFAATLTAIFFCLGCMSEGASDFEETSLPPEDIKNFSRPELIVYSSPAKYSYEDFLHDVEILRENYPNQIQVVKLCDTADGRGVFDIVLGDLRGENQILIL